MSEFIMDVLKRKFTSGNDTPITRSQISLEEYNQIVTLVDALREDADHAYSVIACLEDDWK